MAVIRSFVLIAIFLLTGLPLLAQTVVITCSSTKGRRNFCAVDTRGGVTLARQLSSAPCRLNYSWGFDQRGIWVDRDCRGDFVIRRVVYGPGVPVQTVTCNSGNGRRVYCAANTSRGVILVRQRSGAVCRQGYSWGFDKRGIWVDRGCYADFRLGTMVPPPR